jgi:hypothetical protein
MFIGRVRGAAVGVEDGVPETYALADELMTIRLSSLAGGRVPNNWG